MYEGVIHLVPNKDLEPPSNKQCINRPPLKRLHGRSRKARRREEGEGGCSSSEQKLLAAVKCPNYMEFGHNKHTCERATVPISV